MEDVIIEVLGDLAEFLLISAVGLGAFIAAQFFINQYKDAIFEMLRGSLKEHPNVKTIVMAVVQKNEQAVSHYINGSRYFATRFLGIPTGSNTTAGAVEIRSSVRKLSMNEMEREGLLSGIRNGHVSDAQQHTLKGLTEEELLELGLIPEKVAKGKRLIDKDGNIKGAATICSEQEVLRMRDAA